MEETIETLCEKAAWLKRLKLRLQIHDGVREIERLIEMIGELRTELRFEPEEFTAAVYLKHAFSQNKFSGQIMSSGMKSWQDEYPEDAPVHYDGDREAYVQFHGVLNLCKDHITLSPFDPEAQNRISNAVAELVMQNPRFAEGNELFVALYVSNQWVQVKNRKEKCLELEKEIKQITEEAEKALMPHYVFLNKTSSISTATFDMLDQHPGRRPRFLELT